MYTVLIVDQDGSTMEQNWSAEAVERLVLPVDPFAMPPKDISDRPKTKKEAYSFNYSTQPAIEVELPDEGEAAADTEEALLPEPEWSSYATTSPQALALGLFAWIIGLGLRNMVVSGSPFDLARRERHRVEQQKAAGDPARAQQGRSAKTAPSGATSRKNKRRRR
jgi:hypothetical protein